MQGARNSSLAGLLLLALMPGVALAQGSVPLGGLVTSLFDKVTPNATTPNPANPAATIDHSSHFFLGGENITPATRQLNIALATQLSTFPLASSSGGFTYSISGNGDIVPTSTTFGPSFAERAVTIGRNKLNFGYTFQSTGYSSFEGADLENGEVRFVSQHNNCCPPGTPQQVAFQTDGVPAFERDLLASQLTMQLDTRTTAFFANYGITNRFDVGLAVPIVHVSIDATVTGTILRTGEPSPAVHQFSNGTAVRTERATGSKTGLGDVLVRAKYNVFRGSETSVAAAMDLRLPTGDSAELLGTGATRVGLFAIASGEYGRFSPHINFGYTFSSGEGSDQLRAVTTPTQFGTAPEVTAAVSSQTRTTGVDLSIPDEVNYIFGFNVAAHPRVTLGFDVRGRTVRDIYRFAVADRSFPTSAASAFGPAGTVYGSPQSNVFGLGEPTRGNLNQLLGVIGGKVNIAGTFLLNVTVLVPMSDSGLKAKPTPVIGFDYVF